MRRMLGAMNYVAGTGHGDRGFEVCTFSLTPCFAGVLVGNGSPEPFQRSRRFALCAFEEKPLKRLRPPVWTGCTLLKQGVNEKESPRLSVAQVPCGSLGLRPRPRCTFALRFLTRCYEVRMAQPESVPAG